MNCWDAGCLDVHVVYALENNKGHTTYHDQQEYVYYYNIIYDMWN
jgi:hypothetical protein